MGDKTNYNFYCFNRDENKECPYCNSKGEVVMPSEKTMEEVQDVKLECLSRAHEGQNLYLKLMGVKLGGVVPKFSGKLTSRDERNTILKERARDHFNREIREVKNEKWKKLMSDD